MLLTLLTEGYGRTKEFSYDRFNVDPRPNALILGKWRHPNTRNTLVAGINLNYLTDSQIEHLQRVLPQILSTRDEDGTVRPRSLKDRYWAGRELAPDIFNNFYRTYNIRFVHAVTPGTLKFWSQRAQREKERRERELQARRQELSKAATQQIPEPPPPEPEEPPEEPEEPPEAPETPEMPEEPPEAPEIPEEPPEDLDPEERRRAREETVDRIIDSVLNEVAYDCKSKHS